MSNEELVERIQHGINRTEYLGQLYIQNKGFIFKVVRSTAMLARVAITVFQSLRWMN